MHSIIGLEVDVELAEDLSRNYGIDYVEAREVSRSQTYNQFYGKFGVLESLVGAEQAKAIVRNGSFINYLNGSFDAYIKLVRIAAGRLNYEVNPESLSSFMSIESLTDFLNPSPKRDEIPSGLDFWKYRIFSTDEKAMAYLDKLIKDGELTLGSHEHWASNNSQGARGLSILAKILHEIKLVFSTCGWETPKISLNRGARLKLTLDQKTSKLLEKLRKAAYNNR